MLGINPDLEEEKLLEELYVKVAQPGQPAELQTPKLFKPLKAKLWFPKQQSYNFLEPCPKDVTKPTNYLREMQGYFSMDYAAPTLKPTGSYGTLRILPTFKPASQYGIPVIPKLTIDLFVTKLKNTRTKT